MITNQDWIEAYKELCAMITHATTGIPEIKHIDLWYNQLNYEQEEYPYPESTLFIEFNTDTIETIGMNVQDMLTRIRFIYCFDTLSDTYDKSENQAVALAFGVVMRKLHKLLQAKSGTHFSSLNRIALTRVEAPEACISYAQTYTCIIRDYGAMQETTEGDMQEANITLEIQKGSAAPPPDMNLFEVDM